MLRSNCINKINSTRCGRVIRARVPYKYCRACYRSINKTARPIGRIKKERTIRHKPTPVETTKTKRKR